MKNNHERASHRLRSFLNRMKRFFMPWAEPAEPEDPYAYSMAALRRPSNKGGAAAVAELDESDLDEE